MKHIIENCNEKLYNNSIWKRYFADMSIGVADIETTGLNPSGNSFILGGIYNSKEGRIHQILAEHRGEEADALAEFMAEINKVDMLVTYNGRRFDLPFLERRVSVYEGCPGLQACLNRDFPYNLDLYLVASRHSPIKRLLPNMKQKTVESYMGLWQTRADEISGAESAELYFHYESTADPETEKKILLHNNDDIRQLGRLIKLISKSNFHEAMFCMGFPVGDLIVDRSRLYNDYLCVSGRQKRGSDSILEYQSFNFGDCPVQIRFNALEASFELRIPLIRESGLAVLDLEAMDLDVSQFSIYPSCQSGFLVIEDSNGLKHMEINSFIIEFIRKFQRENI